MKFCTTRFDDRFHTLLLAVSVCGMVLFGLVPVDGDASFGADADRAPIVASGATVPAPLVLAASPR